MDAIETLREILRTTPRVRLAVLFGSGARGTLRSESDLDVGVLLDGDADLSSLTVALERATGRRVDLIDLNGAPPLLRFEIARSGEVLVERIEFAWADFRARAMIDWWDWAPTARIIREVMLERLRTEARSGPA